jgi:uncharacterized protein Usg
MDKAPAASFSDREPDGSVTSMSHLSLQLKSYRLTTAEILYHLPDHPDLLQSYVWQDLDLAPQFPVLRRFLAFWRDNLDGALHSVRVGHAQLIKPAQFRFADAVIVN